jgi:hypothetical protein
METTNTTNLLPAIIIDAAPIRAAIHCAAGTKDLRAYLRGVYVKLKNAPAGMRATVAGCDGHALYVGLAELSTIDDRGLETWAGTSLIVPPDVIKKLDKKARAFELVQLGANVYKLGGVVFEPMEGQYPDIGRVIPDRPTLDAREVKPAIYNPDLLVRARKALQEHYGTKPTTVFQFAQYGDDCGIMHAGENSAHVVVMPMRANGVEGGEALQAFNRDYL